MLATQRQRAGAIDDGHEEESYLIIKIPCIIIKKSFNQLNVYSA